MKTSDKIAYFGYGSLVNLSTLRTPYISAHRAKISGWQRVWKTRPPVSDVALDNIEIAFLSVEPARDGELDGLLLVDHRDSLPALDQREALYYRHDLPRERLNILDEVDDNIANAAFLYQHKADFGEAGNPVILRSYLDTVSQGYLHHFGPDGLKRFRTSTRNFHLKVYEDREAPVYPRPIELSNDERRVIDSVFPPAPAAVAGQ